jgi:hypothetical protein
MKVKLKKYKMGILQDMDDIARGAREVDEINRVRYDTYRYGIVERTFGSKFASDNNMSNMLNLGGLYFVGWVTSNKEIKTGYFDSNYISQWDDYNKNGYNIAYMKDHIWIYGKSWMHVGSYWESLSNNSRKLYVEKLISS